MDNEIADAIEALSRADASSLAARLARAEARIAEMEALLRKTPAAPEPSVEHTPIPSHVIVETSFR